MGIPTDFRRGLSNNRICLQFEETCDIKIEFINYAEWPRKSFWWQLEHIFDIFKSFLLLKANFALTIFFCRPNINFSIWFHVTFHETLPENLNSKTPQSFDYEAWYFSRGNTRVIDLKTLKHYIYNIGIMLFSIVLLDHRGSYLVV